MEWLYDGVRRSRGIVRPKGVCAPAQLGYTTVCSWRAGFLIIALRTSKERGRGWYSLYCLRYPYLERRAATGPVPPEASTPDRTPRRRRPRPLASPEGATHGAADSCADAPNPVALPGTASVHEAACALRDADMGDVMVIEHN